MNKLSTAANNHEQKSFKFNTTYKGNKMSLKIVADDGKYTVLHEDKPFGHIKIGEKRHTWYVENSYYPAASLVKTIGKKIQDQYQLAS